MAKAAKKKATTATAVAMPAISFNVLAGLIANSVVDKLGRGANPQTDARQNAEAPMCVPAPNPPRASCSIDMIGNIRERARGLLARLIDFEAQLMKGVVTAEQNSTITSGCSSSGLNGTLEETLEILSAAHAAMSRIAGYTGVEV